MYLPFDIVDDPRNRSPSVIRFGLVPLVVAEEVIVVVDDDPLEESFSREEGVGGPADEGVKVFLLDIEVDIEPVDDPGLEIAQDRPWHGLVTLELVI